MPFALEEVDGSRRTLKLSVKEVWALAESGAARLKKVVGPAGGCGRFVVSGVGSGVGMAVVPVAIWVWGGAVATMDVAGEPAWRLRSSFEALGAAACVVDSVTDSEERSDSTREKLGSEAVVISVEEMLGRTGAVATRRMWPPFEIGTRERSPTSHCFFTSGTTGRPKGCVCTRFALRAYALGRNTVDSVSAESRLAIVSAHTFDPSLGDVAQAAIAGATLLVSRRPIKSTDVALFVHTAQPTHVTTTPRVWGGICSVPPCLKVLSLGGEAAPPAVVARTPSGVDLKIVYGTTEACVYQTSCSISTTGDLGILGPPIPGARIGLLPIVSDDDDDDVGRALSPTSASVRWSSSGKKQQDDRYPPPSSPRPPSSCAVGVEAEICVGGDLVVGARYLRGTPRPHFSEERQSANSELFFDDADGVRWYRTGDRGRVVDTKGAVRLLGRVDSDETKIRGVRVALREVEALVLAGCAVSSGLVEACSALKTTDGALAAVVDLSRGERGLRPHSKKAAFASPAEAACLSLLTARRAPARLVPTVWVDAGPSALWPKAATGKTDRTALASLVFDLVAARTRSDDDDDDSHTTNATCATHTEVAVSRCWRQVVLAEADPRREKTSAADDFALMGGDSISALRAARRLEAWLSGLETAVRGAGGPAGDVPVDAFPPDRMLTLRVCRRYAAAVGDVFADDPRFAPSTRENDARAVAGRTDTANDDDGVDERLFAGLDLDLDSWSDDLDDDDIDGALGLAAGEGRPDLVAALLCDASDPVPHRGHRLRPTPLHRAAAAGADACVDLLLRRHPPTAVDAQRRSPLFYAAANGRPDACERLLAAGAPILARDALRQTVLHACCRGGDAATASRLLDVLDPDDSARLLDARDRWGRPALAWLALRSRDDPAVLDLATRLIDAGADPDPPARRGKSTALVPETPLGICRRLSPPDGGALGRLLHAAVASSSATSSTAPGDDSGAAR